MTNDQSNIAIAQACGWTDITLRPHDMGELPPRLVGFHKETGERKFLPNYCNDLNAIRGATQALSVEQRRNYASELSYVVQRDNNYDSGGDEDYLLLDASPTQRAEAFLRTVGKWEEGK